jgi:hypothetical protein
MVELYHAVDGLDAQPVEIAQVASRLGLKMSNPDDRLEVRKRVSYLQGEGLLKASGTTDDIKSITLTHRGVREVEDAISEPDKPTEHFPPLDSVRASAASDSPTRRPDSEAARALTVITENNRLEVVRMIQALKSWPDQLDLDEEQRSEIEADIQTIEAQLGSPRPKAQLLEISLQSIKRTIEEASSVPGTPAGIISAGISRTITDFIEKLP